MTGHSSLCVVDWAAAGSWAQAVATAAGAAAVIYAAKQGRAAFALWRLQKQAEHRMAAADAIMKLAYRAQLAFPVIRSRMMWAGELEAAEASLRASGEGFANAAPERQSKLRTAQVFLDRLRAEAPLWDELVGILPAAKAYFGQTVADHVRTLLKQRQTVQNAAEFYPDDYEAIRGEVHATLYAGVAGEDKVTETVEAAVGALEAIMLPEIRSDIATT